jgi:hypothetical protein
VAIRNYPQFLPRKNLATAKQFTRTFGFAYLPKPRTDEDSLAPTLAPEDTLQHDEACGEKSGLKGHKKGHENVPFSVLDGLREE